MSYVKSQMRSQKQGKARKSRLVGGWMAVPSHLLGMAIASLSERGCAIMFSGSSADTLMTMTVYDDGDKEKYYIRPHDNPVDVLAEAIECHCAPSALDAFEAVRSGDEGKDKHPAP